MIRTTNDLIRLLIVLGVIAILLMNAHAAMPVVTTIVTGIAVFYFSNNDPKGPGHPIPSGAHVAADETPMGGTLRTRMMSQERPDDWPVLDAAYPEIVERDGAPVEVAVASSRYYQRNRAVSVVEVDLGVEPDDPGLVPLVEAARAARETGDRRATIEAAERILEYAPDNIWGLLVFAASATLEGSRLAEGYEALCRVLELTEGMVDTSGRRARMTAHHTLVELLEKRAAFSRDTEERERLLIEAEAAIEQALALMAVDEGNEHPLYYGDRAWIGYLRGDLKTGREFWNLMLTVEPGRREHLLAQHPELAAFEVEENN